MYRKHCPCGTCAVHLEGSSRHEGSCFAKQLPAVLLQNFLIRTLDGLAVIGDHLSCTKCLHTQALQHQARHSALHTHWHCIISQALASVIDTAGRMRLLVLLVLESILLTCNSFSVIAEVILIKASAKPTIGLDNLLCSI